MSCRRLRISRPRLHRCTDLRSLLVLALLVSCTLGENAEAQRKQACDVSQFQGSQSSIGASYPISCTTCVFPSWQAVSLVTTAILQLDLTGKWLYMLGDSTTKQLHTELLDYLDEPQVRLDVSLLVTNTAQLSALIASSVCHDCHPECPGNCEALLERK